MDRWSQHAATPVSRPLGLNARLRLRVLIGLFTLAIQLAIPVAQIWHIATDHTPAVALSEQHQASQSATHRTHVEPHRDRESDKSIDCPVCHAFVYLQDVIDIPAQVTLVLERSICQLPLTGLIAYQARLYAPAPRAPPVFS